MVGILVVFFLVEVNHFLGGEKGCRQIRNDGFYTKFLCEILWKGVGFVCFFL